MRWRSGGFGVTRWVVKVEHALTLALLALIIGGVNLFFGSLIQAGYSSVATSFMTAYFRFLRGNPLLCLDPGDPIRSRYFPDGRRERRIEPAGLSPRLFPKTPPHQRAYLVYATRVVNFRICG
jgi:hypothetical protein